MTYRDDFYTVENIIGHTGDINDNPTVYFLTDLEYGHITQAHRDPDNVGREPVGRRQLVICHDLNDSDFPGYTAISKFGYVAGNAINGDGDRVLFEYFKDDHNRRLTMHESRTEFVDAVTLSAAHTALLAAAIANRPLEKRYRDPADAHIFPDPTGRYAVYFLGGP